MEMLYQTKQLLVISDNTLEPRPQLRLNPWLIDSAERQMSSGQSPQMGNQICTEVCATVSPYLPQNNPDEFAMLKTD